MELLTIKELLETGVHFGHRVRKWNPKMEEYIFTQRKGIHIIDLEKTIRLFEEAYMFMRTQASKGKKAIFVGTKRQVQETIAQEARRCGALFVNHRWLGGTLTNFPTIKLRIERMKKLEEMAESGAFKLLPNKEVVRLRRELSKLQRNLGGLRDMKDIPGVMFVMDTLVEINAIHEARLMGIPVVALVDTNSDPDPVDFPIPGNDDAIKATKLIASRVADSVIEGHEGASSMAAHVEEIGDPHAAAAAEPELESALCNGVATVATEAPAQVTTGVEAPVEPEPVAVAEAAQPSEVATTEVEQESAEETSAEPEASSAEAPGAPLQDEPEASDDTPPDAERS